MRYHLLQLRNNKRTEYLFLSQQSAILGECVIYLGNGILCIFRQMLK